MIESIQGIIGYYLDKIYKIITHCNETMQLVLYNKIQELDKLKSKRR